MSIKTLEAVLSRKHRTTKARTRRTRYILRIKWRETAIYFPVPKKARKRDRLDSELPKSQRKKVSIIGGKKVHSVFPHSKIPRYISYMGVTVTTIPDRINIKRKSYMWGSHFQKDSDHRGRRGIEGQVRWWWWELDQRPLAHSGAGSRGLEMQAGPVTWLQSLKPHPYGHTSAIQSLLPKESLDSQT